MMIKTVSIAAATALIFAASDGNAQSPICVDRGALDTAFCDADRDLVADMPVDQTRWRNPAVVTIGAWPEADLKIPERGLQPLIEHLARCTNKRIALVQVVTPAGQIEAMRAGRLHLSIVRPERMPAAVNVAGAVPFAMLASAQGALSTRAQLHVRLDSGIESPAGLRGKTVAHLLQGNLTGDLALRGLLPQLGIAPGRDYRIRHVASTEDGMAALAAGGVQATVAITPGPAPAAGGRYAPLRRLWESPAIPPAGFVHSHDLVPALRDRLVQCTREFRFTAAMQGMFGEADRVVPAAYARDWESVRLIADAVDLSRTRAAHDAELKAEIQATSGNGSIFAPPTR